MANLLEGLFGLRPNLESQQENMQVDRGMGFGELLGRAGVNPYAPKAVQDAYLGRQAAQGALVGKAMNTAAGLFGIETPELQRAKGMEAILQQTQADTDINNPAEFYPTLAKRLAEGNYTQAAAQIGQVGAKAIQDFNLNTSTVSKNLQEARAKQQGSLLDIAKFEETQLTALDKEYRSKDNVKNQIAQGLILPEEGQARLTGIDANINKMTTGALATVKQRIVSLTDLKANGTMTELQQQQLDELIAMEAKLKAAGSTRVSVSNSTTAQTAYGKQVGKKVADRDIADIDFAEKVASTLPKMEETYKLLQTGDINLGIGGGILQVIDKARQKLLEDDKAGIRVSNTEYTNALLGSDVFPQIAALGIGARGLDTPAEREFLMSVITGSTELTRETLLRMTKFRIDAAKASVERYNSKLAKGQYNQYEDTLGVKLDPITSGAGAVVEQPKARKRFNPTTGKVEEIK
tara:strand:+ start:150 stop:1541 length:1392 start_codon:yes stop_codon:yes gene_type:complete